MKLEPKTKEQKARTKEQIARQSLRSRDTIISEPHDVFIWKTTGSEPCVIIIKKTMGSEPHEVILQKTPAPKHAGVSFKKPGIPTLRNHHSEKLTRTTTHRTI